MTGRGNLESYDSNIASRSGYTVMGFSIQTGLEGSMHPDVDHRLPIGGGGILVDSDLCCANSLLSALRKVVDSAV